ncbi:MAG: hypothetical protein HRF40_01715 [Nitrososphaera sp.]|jgi:hypothetical protein
MIESNTRKESYHEPWLYDDLIVMSKVPNSDALKPVSCRKVRENILSQYYGTVYENKYFVILQSRG